MRTGTIAAIALVGLAVSSPAAAQVTASGFSPASGPVGTQVVIRGNGFTGDTQVVFGRTRVTPERVSRTLLVVVVPANYGDGSIVLRHPGVGFDIEVGRFTVELPLSISGFAPSSGIPGTRVVVRGTGFRKGVALTLGGTAMKITRVTTTRITAVVPDKAKTGRITVATDADSATSRGVFRVLGGAPTVAGLDPAGGTPGTVVRITGDQLHPRATVRYGRRAMRVHKRGAGFIEAAVPADAATSEHIWVTTPTGEARSPGQFQLRHLPSISELRPAFGLPGSQVLVLGKHFRPGDRFTMGKATLRLLQLRPGQATVALPKKAATGPIVVRRGDHKSASPAPFEVVRQPVVTSAKPREGTAGTRVAIRGKHLGDDTVVSLGNRTVEITHRSARKGVVQLTAVIPEQATTAPLVVKTRGGVVTAVESFRIHHVPEVSGVDRTRALIGSEVTITGARLAHAEAVEIAGVELDIVRKTDNQLVAMVTGKARKGPMVVVGSLSETVAAPTFEVVPAPVAREVQPRAGIPGTELVVTGSNLSSTTVVKLGSTVLPVLRISKTGRQLVCVIPKGAQSGALAVGDAGVFTKSGLQLLVMEAPALHAFSPKVVARGRDVTIEGAHFTRSTHVFWNGIELPRAKRDGDKRLIVTLPADLPAGRYPIVLREDGLEVATSTTELEVTQ